MLLCTFISTSHPLYWAFVITVLTYRKCKDAHLKGRQINRNNGKIKTCMTSAPIESYFSLWIELLKYFLSPFLPSVSEQHDHLVTVGSGYIRLDKTGEKKKTNFFPQMI